MWFRCAGYIGNTCGHLQAIFSMLFMLLCYCFVYSNLCFLGLIDYVLQVTWLETDLFTLGLGFLMLSMGLTLTFEDFRRCLRNPWTVRVNEHCCIYSLWQIHYSFNVQSPFPAGWCRFSCTIFDQANSRFPHRNGMFH